MTTIEERWMQLCGKDIEACSYEELYPALMEIVREKK